MYIVNSRAITKKSKKKITIVMLGKERNQIIWYLQLKLQAWKKVENKNKNKEEGQITENNNKYGKY